MEDQLQRIPNMAKGETYRLGFSFLLHVNAKTKFCIGWRLREWKAAMIVISTIIVIAGGAILGRTDAAREAGGRRLMHHVGNIQSTRSLPHLPDWPQITPKASHHFRCVLNRLTRIQTLPSETSMRCQMK